MSILLCGVVVCTLIQCYVYVTIQHSVLLYYPVVHNVLTSILQYIQSQLYYILDFRVVHMAGK